MSNLNENENNQLTQKQKYHKNYLEKYNHTPMGRAVYLVESYRQSDAYHDREQPDFNAKWLKDNIMNKPCVYCGKQDWTQVGTDRIDNSIGHLKSNVVPCCMSCNRKRGRKDFATFYRSTEWMREKNKNENE